MKKSKKRHRLEYDSEGSLDDFIVSDDNPDDAYAKKYSKDNFRFKDSSDS